MLWKGTRGRVGNSVHSYTHPLAEYFRRQRVNVGGRELGLGLGVVPAGVAIKIFKGHCLAKIRPVGSSRL